MRHNRYCRDRFWALRDLDKKTLEAVALRAIENGRVWRAVHRELHRRCLLRWARLGVLGCLLLLAMVGVRGATIPVYTDEVGMVVGWTSDWIDFDFQALVPGQVMEIEAGSFVDVVAGSSARVHSQLDGVGPEDYTGPVWFAGHQNAQQGQYYVVLADEEGNTGDSIWSNEPLGLNVGGAEWYGPAEAIRSLAGGGGSEQFSLAGMTGSGIVDQIAGNFSYGGSVLLGIILAVLLLGGAAGLYKRLSRKAGVVP